MPAPEIGYILTATGDFNLNVDGSLHRFHYDIAITDQGRCRPALTVRGSLAAPDDGSVVIRLVDVTVIDAD